MIRQPFHLVQPSPWPLAAGVGALVLTVGLVAWFHGLANKLLICGCSMVLLVMCFWWRDIVREALYLGHHTTYVVKGLRCGMVLFIVSEVMFFFSFFWAYFHSALAPTPELGCAWPPVGITPLDPFTIPLLNTSILLASGVTVTWAHHSIMGGRKGEATFALSLTAMLGMEFFQFQVWEYKELSFTIADSVYGSLFHVLTSFHGLHVVIGTAFLIVCACRSHYNHFSTGHHFGLEAAAWYWHFVDVVWIMLYLCIYWWGS